jgi:hypothetical protein
MPYLISTNSSLTLFEDISSESDISELTLEVDVTAEGHWANTEHILEDLDDNIPDLVSVSDSLDEDEMPDLVLVSDSSKDNDNSGNGDSADDEIGGLFDVPIEMVDETIDCGTKPEMRTYSTAMLASIALASPNHEIELYDSGASRHMSPYRRNFINFVRIKGQTITATDGQEFMATGLGNMHVELPNGRSMSRILLKDVLYAPNMGATLILISKIAAAGFRTVFQKDLLEIFGPRDSMLGCINVRNGLYRLEHEPHEVAASSTTDTVTIEELHQLMGYLHSPLDPFTDPGGNGGVRWCVVKICPMFLPLMVKHTGSTTFLFWPILHCISPYPRQLTHFHTTWPTTPHRLLD